MKKHISSLLALPVLTGLLLSSALIAASAQEAPPPHKSPRTPVNREALTEHKAAVPTSREIQGQAIVVDGERLRIDDMDLRLFGVVPPQLSASFGPQARTALDELTAAQNVTCLIRDRDREGRFLATCRNAGNADLALELLRRGLAVTARGSVSSTDLATSYIAAEQAAQSQKVGLWSVTVPAAVTVPDAAKTAPTTTAAATPPPATEQPHPKPVEEKPAQVVVKAEQIPPKVAATPPLRSPVTAQATNDMMSSNDDISATKEAGFLARYQLLITGLVMLATALGMLAAISIQRLFERRTEIRAIAAALRGELMAARAVCLGRLRTTGEAEDKDISWPRIRSTLYQAYVGRLGWLGAELARRVASIYGQASDYAAYYDGSDDTRAAALPKRQALQTLAQHIDEVLPHLAMIEHTGSHTSTGIGFSKPVGGGTEPILERPTTSPTKNQTATSALASVTRLWTSIGNLTHTLQKKEKAPTTEDPIAEYTALIEEEMKRFAFDESEEEPTSPPTSIAKRHGIGG